ncbi:MAG TPA: histidine phosphatase family protein [Candidatus Latescibacteria bacterium]|nr:histidine phosphatase family protein [Candidatus Latescibacterota bacterium]
MKESKTELILIRHAQTRWGEGRYCGFSDPPLSSYGRWQVQRLALHLETTEVDSIYSSDLKRARQTAEMLSSSRCLEIKTSPSFREQNFGRWDGMTCEEIVNQDREAYERWLMDIWNYQPPGGENLLQLKKRVCNGVITLITSHRGKRIVLVTHGGPVKILVCTALGLDAAHFWNFRVDQASVSVIEYYDDTPVVSLLNDTCHLSEG